MLLPAVNSNGVTPFHQTPGELFGEGFKTAVTSRDPASA
jgi:hypothetical protein